jgi:ribosomal protein S18 acetylase RimI-like enzyme
MLFIRRAGPADHAAVGEICVAAYAGLSVPDHEQYVEKLRDAATRDREAELWVAVDHANATLLGTVTVCHDGSPWREIGVGDEGEFRMLAVSPAAQGRGVGEALVRMLLDRAGEAGAPRVVLSTLDEMRPAQRLYARMGFARLPARDWSPRRGVDLIAYGLELTR